MTAASLAKVVSWRGMPFLPTTASPQMNLKFKFAAILPWVTISSSALAFQTGIYSDHPGVIHWPDMQAGTIQRVEAGSLIHDELPQAFVLRDSQLWMIFSPTNYPAFVYGPNCSDFAVLPPAPDGDGHLVSSLVASTDSGVQVYDWSPSEQQLVRRGVTLPSEWDGASHLSAMPEGSKILIVGIAQNNQDILRGDLQDSSFVKLDTIIGTSTVSAVVPVELDPTRAGTEIAYVKSDGMRIVDGNTPSTVIFGPYSNLAGCVGLARDPSGGPSGDSVIFAVFDSSSNQDLIYAVDKTGPILPAVYSGSSFHIQDMKIARYGIDTLPDLIASSTAATGIYTLHGVAHQQGNAPFAIQLPEPYWVPLNSQEYVGPEPYETCEPSAPLIACADFDGDGDGDLLIASSDCETFSVVPGQRAFPQAQSQTPLEIPLPQEGDPEPSLMTGTPYTKRFLFTVTQDLKSQFDSSCQLSIKIESWVRDTPSSSDQPWGEPYILPDMFDVETYPDDMQGAYPHTYEAVLANTVPGPLVPASMLLYVQITATGTIGGQVKQSSPCSFVFSENSALQQWLVCEHEPDRYTTAEDCEDPPASTTVQSFHRRTSVNPFQPGSPPHRN